jgi:hypothetical protein
MSATNIRQSMTSLSQSNSADESLTYPKHRSLVRGRRMTLGQPESTTATEEEEQEMNLEPNEDNDDDGDDEEEDCYATPMDDDTNPSMTAKKVNKEEDCDDDSLSLF